MSTEHLVLKIIYNYGGEISVFTIAREAGLSTDYARMICESLGRRDYIDYWASRGLCILREKGVEIAKKTTLNRIKKISRGYSSGFFKRRGKLIMGY